MEKNGYNFKIKCETDTTVNEWKMEQAFSDAKSRRRGEDITDVGQRKSTFTPHIHNTNQTDRGSKRSHVLCWS